MAESQNTVSQSIDGYKCSCGYVTDNKGKFLAHIGHSGRREGKEAHQSLGRVNMVTGEITMPPYEQRTPEQKDASNYGQKAKKIGKDGKQTTIRTTEILAQASEIKFIPRIYTTTYTPIMQSAQDAAVKYFGWRPDMPFENFMDTVLYLYFKEHGVTLGGYTVDEDLVTNALQQAQEDAEAAEAEELKKREDEAMEEQRRETILAAQSQLPA